MQDETQTPVPKVTRPAQSISNPHQPDPEFYSHPPELLQAVYPASSPSVLSAPGPAAGGYLPTSTGFTTTGLVKAQLSLCNVF